MEFNIVAPKVFNYYLEKNKRLEFLTMHSEANLGHCKLLLTKTKEGGAGFGLTPDRELFNVFNNTDIKGLGGVMVRCAIDLGACKLLCFDGYLCTFYESFGFRTVESLLWNDKLAPANWDYETYGKPNVVYMER